MKPTFLSILDPLEVIAVENQYGFWAVRFKNLVTGATLPDMASTGEDKPTLYVGMKCTIEVKVIPTEN